jgi:hypothetical protein
MVLGLFQDILHLSFLVVAPDELRLADTCHLPFQLVVDVEVGSNCAFEVVLLHAGITAFDDLQHFGAVGVEFVVPLGDLVAAATAEKLVYGAPEEQRHFLFHKILEDFCDLEVELQKTDPESLVGDLVGAHLLHYFGVLVLQGSVERQVGNLVVLSAAGGLAVAEMFELEPALDAEHSLFLEADILEITGVPLVAAIVLL